MAQHEFYVRTSHPLQSTVAPPIAEAALFEPSPLLRDPLTRILGGHRILVNTFSPQELRPSTKLVLINLRGASDDLLANLVALCPGALFLGYCADDVDSEADRLVRAGVRRFHVASVRCTARVLASRARRLIAIGSEDSNSR